MFHSWCTPLSLGIATCFSSGPSQVEGQPPSADTTLLALDALVDQYFHANDAKDRAKLASLIEKESDGSIEAVAATVRRAMVWPLSPATDHFNVQTASNGKISVLWRGSKDPDPTKPQPLVLCMPAGDESEDVLHQTLNRAAALGPTFFNSCSLAALSRPIAGSFHQHPEAANDLKKIVRELRKHFQLDTDRLYLFGLHEGGEAAWMASLFQPDLFAGVIAVDAVPKLPFPQQSGPLLLPNHKDAAVFVLKTEPGPIGTSAFGSINAVEPALAEIGRTLRPKPGRTVSHWFRYPAQGDVVWLRTVKTYGDVWTEDQLSIAVAPTADRDAFITDVLKEKLYFLGGRVEGQSITIETKRIAEVELRLFEGMVDFTKPITVHINGRRRHGAIIKPNIAVLLESAYDDWELQRLVRAKLSFSIRED